MRATAGKAFTLPEILIGIALSAILLAAVGTAMHGSLTNHAENTKITAVTQAARFALNRITRDIRTAAAVDEYAGTTVIRIVPPYDGSGIQQVQYEYDADTRSLLYRVTTSGSTTTHTLFGGQDDVAVKSFSAVYERGKDAQGLDCAKSVTLRLEFEIEHQVFAVTASAAPRRNQLY